MDERADAGNVTGAIVLAGAGNTYNLGVGALRTALVQALAARCPSNPVVVLDDGRGVRVDRELDGLHPGGVWRVGARYSRKVTAPESAAQIALALRLGVRTNPAARVLREAKAVIDVGAGDSFSDTYGAHRFSIVMAPKRLARLAGLPLFLAPQNYGPYTSERSRRQASGAVRRAEMAWARDSRSLTELGHLLGSGFDPARHRSSPDLAFSMTPRAPSLPTEFERLLGRDDEIIGMNVSGLLFRRQASRSFGLATDYRELSARLLQRLLDVTQARILLLPHVLGAHGIADLASGSTGIGEDDAVASAELVRRLPAHARERILVPPAGLSAAETKWLVAQHCTWMLGTRTHATIAALSSGVPAVVIAYSDKAHGVFASCGQEHAVVDARWAGVEAAWDVVATSYQRRTQTGQDLLARLPTVTSTLQGELDLLGASVSGTARPVNGAARAGRTRLDVDVARLRTRAKHAVPPAVARTGMQLLGVAHSARTRGDAVQCPLCAGSFARFLPFNGRPGVMCPRCRSFERHRALWLFLERHTSVLRTRVSMLHIAPEAALERRLRAVPTLMYLTGDLLRPEADLRLDVTRIDLPDASFDVVLCAHVLEHVQDDRRAMRELRRITKDDGWAVIEAPVRWRLPETFEDWSVTSPAGRRRVFGQWDHVRIYGRNYPDLLAASGWALQPDPVTFSQAEKQRYGLGSDRLFYCTPI